MPFFMEIYRFLQAFYRTNRDKYVPKLVKVALMSKSGRWVNVPNFQKLP